MTEQPRCAKCGGLNDRVVREGRRRQSYCRACHSAAMRATRPKYGELNESARRKAITRSYTRELVKRGHLDKQPCAKCGSATTQAHHDDYGNPRHVEWLCRPCHEIHHPEQA